MSKKQNEKEMERSNELPLNLLYAEDMENAVLAAAMLETASLNEVAGFVRPEMFYQKENQISGRPSNRCWRKTSTRIC